MIDERIKEASHKTEQLLLLGLCQDYNNYNKIKRYITSNDFLHPEFQKVYDSIFSLYEKSSFKEINNETIEIYSTDKNLSPTEKNRLLSFITLSKNINVDFDGTFNMFRRNSGMYKLVKEANKCGGFEKLFLGIYENTETVEEIKDKIDIINRLCFKNYKTSTKSASLADGMVDYVKNRMFAKDDRSVDFQGFPLLQSYSKGIHVGLTGIFAQSGVGKTTLSIPCFIMPILESGQKVLSVHNEQEEDEIRQIYLMSFISRIKKNKLKLHRDNFNSMNEKKLSNEQKEYLIQCAREFEERYKDRLEFVFVPRFNEDDLEALILDYNRKGFNNVLLDTFKTEDSTSGWEGMDNLSKRMDGVSKELGIKIVYTGQLAAHMSWRKYLTVSCIGKAKSLKETATSLYMFRPLAPEEIPNIKFASYKKNESTNEWEWINNQELPIFYDNEQKRRRQYFAFFNDKQRKGKCGNIIIIEYDLGGLYFKEIGVTESIKNDDNGR